MDKNIRVRVKELEKKTGIVSVNGYHVASEKEWQEWKASGEMPGLSKEKYGAHVKVYHEDASPNCWD